MYIDKYITGLRHFSLIIIRGKAIASGVRSLMTDMKEEVIQVKQLTHEEWKDLLAPAMVCTKGGVSVGYSGLPSLKVKI